MKRILIITLLIVSLFADDNLPIKESATCSNGFIVTETLSGSECKKSQTQDEIK